MIKTLSQLLSTYCYKYSNNVLFEANGIQITYKQFFLDVAYFANKFGKQIKKNNNLILATTSYIWAVAYFGIVVSGGIAVLAEPNLSSEELKILCSKYEIKTIITDIALLNLKINNISVINFDEIEINTAHQLDNILPDTSEDEICTIAFTSGTTDVSKGVMLSNKNLCCNVYAGCSVYKYEMKDVILNILPLYHLFGLTCVLLASIINGNKIVFSNTKTFFDDLKIVNPTFLLLVPEIAKFLLLKISKYGLQETVGNCLSKILCGGAQIGETIIKSYRKLGIGLSSCYGITECSPGVAINPLINGRDNAAGLIVPCNEVKIAEKNQEILIKGSNVTVGYYNNQQLTDKVIIDGWFHTGDIGFIKDGFLFVTGRIKNLMIFDNGKKVCPEELENKFLQYPEIDEIIVYKQKNQIYAKIFSNAFLKHREIYDAICNIVEQINSTLPIYKRVNKFELTDQPFEKTYTNKIKRRDVI